tara:strand:+ start:1066 stop:1641 length:576 start_codon:yes stop_codon:yes gene_type:complete
MFYKLNLYQKIIALCLLYTIVFSISFYLFKYSTEAMTSREIILFNFLQVWDLMLVGFLFFQTFKYVRMPKSFYLQRKYENKKYFKYLGVNLFRLLLINSFFRHLNNRVYLKGKAKNYLLTFIEETKQSETSHIISGIFPLSIQLLYLKYGLIEHFIWLSIFNIILNLYPLLLQRMNRFNMFTKYPNLTEKN